MATVSCDGTLTVICVLTGRSLRSALPPVLRPFTQLHAWWHIFAGYATYIHILYWYVQNFVRPASLRSAIARCSFAAPIHVILCVGHGLVN